ncbi:MAG: sigma-70 family RNA polymerase sigma factor [Planctomycetaceae bacterium]
MSPTHLSLLKRAQAGSAEGWQELADLYSPLIQGWLQKRGVAHHDAEELSQDVMAVVIRELPQFKHSGRLGAFRRWLREITAFRTKHFWRTRKAHPESPGGSEFSEIVKQLEDDSSPASRLWDREHDEYLLRVLFAQIEAEFEQTTVVAFRRLVLDSVPVKDVAAELNLSVGAVYTAKSRVLRKLRQEAEGLMDDSTFC